MALSPSSRLICGQGAPALTAIWAMAFTLTGLTFNTQKFQSIASESDVSVR